MGRIIAIREGGDQLLDLGSGMGQVIDKAGQPYGDRPAPILSIINRGYWEVTGTPSRLSEDYIPGVDNA